MPSKPQTRVDKVKGMKRYIDIRNDHLAKGILFEDPDFPATDRSLYFSTAPPRAFEWKRPKDIVNDPRMFVGGATRFDVKQGELGNCWFLAAIASLCAAGNMGGTNDLLSRVIPKDNSFVENYAGVFHFQIWQYGEWVDVVIDDYLPTINGRLMFMHSESNNEFWTALLEKAYAKLMGSYEALQGGCSSEAMEDMTGGVVETFNFTKEIPPNMYTIMAKAHERRSLMGCQIDAPPTQIESVLGNGLIIGHAYSITGVKTLTVQGKNVQLVRIRNPWGNEYEWKGAWGDSSPEWNNVPEKDRKAMGLDFESDGEFWMSFEDFTKNFQKMEICNLSIDSTGDAGDKRKWETSINNGSWKARVTAGGCRNFLDTFWTNPQYRVEVVDPDEDDEENTGTLIVALMQKEGRKKKAQGLDYLTIGYSVYKLSDKDVGPLDMNFFKYNAAVGRSAFSNAREMCSRFRLPPAHYVIIPTSFKPNEEAEFVVRIFSERPNNTSEIDEETGFAPDDEDEAEPEQVTAEVTPQAESTPGTEVDVKQRNLRARKVTENDIASERAIRDLFKDTAGEDMELDAYELKKVIDSHFKKEFKFDGFSLETCRSMVAMKDADRSGKLGYDEFKTLWSGLRRWTKIFLEFDQDKSMTFNSYELRQALNSAGIKVSNKTFDCLVMRYANQQGTIQFDDFICCAVRLKSMFDYFKKQGGGQKTAKIELDQFIQTTMYS